MQNKMTKKETSLGQHFERPYHTKKVLTFDEASEYTGIRKSYLYKLTHRADIPFYKPRGKMIYFDRDELEQWLLQGKVKSSDEINLMANEQLILNSN